VVSRESAGIIDLKNNTGNPIGVGLSQRNWLSKAENKNSAEKKNERG